MNSFKVSQFPKDVILYAVYFYLRYSVSYRDLEEIMAERGLEVDLASLNRWVVKYAPLIAVNAQMKKRSTLGSWRMDETYVQVRGKWMYLYRAVGKEGNTLDFQLSERRNGPAGTNFFTRTLSSSDIPRKIVIDKNRANAAGIQEINRSLKRFGYPAKVPTIRSKYLHNIVEQDHCFIKRRIRNMGGFKSFRFAATTLEGIKIANMIRKGQFGDAGVSSFKEFAQLAEKLRQGQKTFSPLRDLCDTSRAPQAAIQRVCCSGENDEKLHHGYIRIETSGNQCPVH